MTNKVKAYEPKSLLAEILDAFWTALCFLVLKLPKVILDRATSGTVAIRQFVRRHRMRRTNRVLSIFGLPTEQHISVLRKSDECYRRLLRDTRTPPRVLGKISRLAFVATMLGVLTNYALVSLPSLMSSTTSVVLFLVIAFGVIALSSITRTRLEQLKSRVASHMDRGLQAYVFDRYLALDPSAHLDKERGQIAQRATDNLWQTWNFGSLYWGVMESRFTLISAVVLPTIYFWIALGGWSLLVIAVLWLSTLGQIATSRHASVRYQHANDRYQRQTTRSNSLRNTLYYPRRICHVKLVGRAHNLRHKILGVCGVLRRSIWGITRIEQVKGRRMMLAGLCIGFGGIVAILLLRTLTTSEPFPGATFWATTLMTVMQVRGALVGLGSQQAQLGKSQHLLSHVFRVSEAERVVSIGEGERTVDTNHTVGVETQNLSFSHSNSSTRPALHEVSAAFKPGKTTVLVGFNGSGKTTLADHIAMLHPFKEGTIFATNGGAPVDLARVHPNHWRTRLSYQTQGVDNIPGYTIRELIAGSGREGQGDKTLVDTLVNLTQLSEVVRDLKHGLDTMIAPAYEVGAGLSGGEMQKVILAQILFRALTSHPGVVVLDEPTASMDPQAEPLILEAALEMLHKHGCTVILITHRLNIVQEFADHVIVMQEGKVVEQGTPRELFLQVDGQYRKLFDTQARGFLQAYAVGSAIQ